VSRRGGGRRDYLAIVEAAYAQGRSDQEWVQGIAEAALPIVDAGHGVLAYTYDASEPGTVHMGAYAEAGSTIPLEPQVRAFTAALAPELVEPFYSASPPTQVLRTILPAAPVPASRSVLEKGPVVVMDAVGIRGHNPDARGCVISAPSTGPYGLPPRTRASLDRVALHLAAAHRLRRRQGSLDPLSWAEAIFSTKGKLEHSAVAGSPPAALQGAVEKRLIGQRVRAEEPERALELWRALVAGQWTVVDHVDHDGKRFLLAQRNDVTLLRPTALDRNERMVALYASWGHSGKLMAYELGLSEAAVSSLLASVLKKLRLRSRADLVGLFGTPSDVEASRSKPTARAGGA
jgi:DNA-binding CsgD family transcriptional regulator